MTRFPWWSTPESLPGGARQLIPLPKCCSYPRLPKTSRAGALTAQIVNFSEFQPFPPRFSLGPALHVLQVRAQPVVEQGCSPWLWTIPAMQTLAHPCSAPALEPHTELDTDPESWGDLQDPTAPLCPLTVPVPHPHLHLKRVRVTHCRDA